MAIETDSNLLTTYAHTRSADAFAAIVERHLNLVYSAACRQVRDPHLAQDVTQAVFLILSRRATSISNPAALPGWLLKTTRYACLNALKAKARRHVYETRAAAMMPTTVEPAHDALAKRLSPLVDDALARLSATDRTAVVLRFFENQSFPDIGSTLGISEEAAQKRVHRALGKLRDLLARLGIDCPADALAPALAAPLLQTVAPSALAPLLIGGSASASVVSLAKGAAHAALWAHAKLAVTAAAATIAICCTTFAVVAQSRPAPLLAQATPSDPITTPAPPAVTPPPADAAAGAASTLFPLKVANITFFENWDTKLFQVGVDPTTKREGGSGAAAVLIQSTTKEWGKAGTALRTIPTMSLVGKRIRFSAWLKTENLANWASLRLLAMDTSGRIYAHADVANDYPLVGTNDWTKREIVCDIPSGCTVLRFGMSMYGAGKMWMDDAQIDIVGDDVPITDDQIMHPWSFSRKQYDCKLDESTQRNGHATQLLSSDKAQNGFWIAWDQNDRHPEKYFGKKVRMSAWIKTEKVSVPSGITVRILGPGFQSLVNTPSVRTNIRGTTDWKKYEVIFDVPDDCQTVCTGVRLCGKGKLWVDDIRYEILPN